jgi:hypothetical protein
MRLKHVDLIEGCIHQDARDVRTKFSKTFSTYFFPVGDETFRIVEAWVSYLREEKLWSNDDPLFPATRLALGRLANLSLRSGPGALEQRLARSLDISPRLCWGRSALFQPAQLPKYSCPAWPGSV